MHSLPTNKNKLFFLLLSLKKESKQNPNKIFTLFTWIEKKNSTRNLKFICKMCNLMRRRGQVYNVTRSRTSRKKSKWSNYMYGTECVYGIRRENYIESFSQLLFFFKFSCLRSAYRKIVRTLCIAADVAGTSQSVSEIKNPLNNLRISFSLITLITKCIKWAYTSRKTHFLVMVRGMHTPKNQLCSINERNNRTRMVYTLHISKNVINNTKCDAKGIKGIHYRIFKRKHIIENDEKEERASEKKIYNVDEKRERARKKTSEKRMC